MNVWGHLVCACVTYTMVCDRVCDYMHVGECGWMQVNVSALWRVHVTICNGLWLRARVCVSV